MSSIWEPAGPSAMKAAIRPRVLFVEDDPSVLALYGRVFSKCDWNVEFAESAESAVEKCAAGPSHVYLVDKNLPGKDGMSFIRHVRRDDDQARCILITGYSSRDTAIECANLGVDSYLEKPCRILQLRKYVTSLMEASPMRSPLSVRITRHFACEPDLEQSLSPGVVTEDKRHLLVVSSDAATREIATATACESAWSVELVDDLDGALARLSAGNVGAAFVDFRLLRGSGVAKLRAADPLLTLVVLGKAPSLTQAQRLIQLHVSAILDGGDGHGDDDVRELFRLVTSS